MKTYKLIPKSLMSITGWHVPVARYIAHQPFSKEHGCIKAELVAVECILLNGDKRWYGFEHAHITSSLRMAVSGFDPRFEEVQAWQDYNEE